MIGSTVTRSPYRWVVGGRVEQRHKALNDLYGIRGRDGHLYWSWRCDFGTVQTGNLFAPL